MNRHEREDLKQEFSLSLTSCAGINAYIENLTAHQESRLKERADVVLDPVPPEVDASRAVINPKYLYLPGADHRKADPRKELSLGAYRFDPKVRVPLLPEELCVDPSVEGDSWYIVQLDHRPSIEEAAHLKSLQLSLAQPLSGFGFLEKMNFEKYQTLSNESMIRYMDFLQPGYKIDPNLEAENGNVIGRVWLWSSEDGDKVCSESALKVEVLPGLTIDKLRDEAKKKGAVLLERAGLPSLRSYTTSWTIQSNKRGERPLSKSMILGQGQVVGIIDDDVQRSHGALPSNKFITYEPPSRLSFPGTPHGTRVAVLLAGTDKDNANASNLDGQAPEALLRFTWWGELKKNPEEFLRILEKQYGYDSETRVFSNSWGDNNTDSYTSWARQADDFSWNHEDALVVFSVNEEMSANGETKVKSPENAKNVLAVGASEKPSTEGKIGSGGEGPTRDGRRKPDMFVPGCEMILAKVGTSDVEKVSGCFTSWASPVAAGAAALVRQYFEEGWYPDGEKGGTPLYPSGALLKAMLLNASVDMDKVSGYPNNKEGWGRLQLNRSVYIKPDSGQSPRRTLVWDILSEQGKKGIEEGEKEEYKFTIPKDSNEELRVTLVWTDRPGCLSYEKVLINNLSLLLVDPDGKMFRGEDLNNKFDDNVQQIIIAQPKNGDYTVTVSGTEIPKDRQGFALVVSGPI